MIIFKIIILISIGIAGFLIGLKILSVLLGYNQKISLSLLIKISIWNIFNIYAAYLLIIEIYNLINKLYF